MVEVFWLKVKVIIGSIIIFCMGIIVGIEISAQNTKSNDVETIDTHINLILPKNEKDLKKQLLYNACSRTMLQEMLNLNMVAVEKPGDQKFEIKSGKKNQ